MLIAWILGIAAYMYAAVLSDYDGILGAFAQSLIGGVVSGVFTVAVALILRQFESYVGGLSNLALRMGCCALLILGALLIWYSSTDGIATFERDLQTGEMLRVLGLKYALSGFVCCIVSGLMLSRALR